jgi:hypothetical protein
MSSLRYVPPQLRHQTRPSRGIEHFFEEKLSELAKPGEKLVPNIYNLEEYFKTYPNPLFNREYYLRCKSFIDSIRTKKGTELDGNKGNIIDLYINPEYQSMHEIFPKMEEIKELYRKLYLDGLQPVNHQLTPEGKIYPDYYKDLYQKGYKPYELLEHSLGITEDITNQNNALFLETLAKRVEGLAKCARNPEGQKPFAKEYFEKEYSRESEARAEGKTEIDLIEEKCKAIYYSQDMLEARHSIQTNETFQQKVIEKYKELFKDPREVVYARTFLPDTETNTYFLADGNIDMEKIAELIKSNNRDLRQFVFGFTDDSKFAEIRELRPFLFEVAGMQESINRIVNCSQLVNWALLLNLLYCRCAVANNKIDFPVRFLIPKESYIKVCDDYLDENGNPVKEIVLRDKIGLVHLFNNLSENKSNNQHKFGSELVGILTIKYSKFNNKKNENELRCWFLFIFKNNDKTDAKVSDYISGKREDLFLTNAFLQFINKGGIAERHNVTHTELTFFYNMIKQKQLNVYAPIYGTELDKFTLFFSKLPHLENNLYYRDKLKIVRVELENLQTTDNHNIFPSKKFKITYHINKHTSIQMQLQTGGSKISKIELYKSTKLDTFYSDEYICGDFYNRFQNLVFKITKYKIKDVYEYFKPLYNYFLIEPRNAKFSYLDLELTEKSKIAKYKPISNVFFMINEIFNKYDIFNFLNNKSKIQYIGTNMGFIEVIKFNNYKIQNIDVILTVRNNYFKNVEKQWEIIINNTNQIYKINIQSYDDLIYNLVDLQSDIFRVDISQSSKLDLIFYDVYVIIKEFTRFETFYNIPSIFTGLFYSLKNLNHGGTLILNLGSVAYKCTADIYLILEEFFETSDLFYSEIANLYKKNGTIGIFQKFKGCPNYVYNKLFNILEDIKKIFPDGGNEFNITESEVVKQHSLTPLDKPATKIIINGFLNIPESTYSNIMNFNNQRYIKQLIFCNKILNLLESKVSLDIKLPTNEQLTNAILYCQKWNIPYWDKYSSNPFQDKFGRQILSETYGLHQPIMYHFKTPYKFHIVSRITLRFPSNHSSSTNKTKTKTKTYISKHTKKQTHKNSVLRISDFMRDIKLSRPAHDLSFRTTKYIPKSNRKVLIPLTPELDYSNNRLQQVGYLIDSRRDFTKPRESSQDLQNAKWWEVNKAFRYYKHKDDLEKIHLDQVVRTKLKDTSISQAWLKMYEIITDCRLIPTMSKGTFHSFHICEAPGTFINAMNNYIHTKTKYTGFEWHAQSLNPKIARIKDQFGMIRRNPERWDYGADQTGDITKVRNIQYYKKQVAKRTPINLMTSDCGLAMKEPGYEKVAFASLLAILDILPVNGTMVYKILTPIDEPIILNLVYVAYCNFKELVFYKPVQNNHSREFYIIGKGYLGTNPDILEKFYDVLKQFKDTQKDDLFKDKYPEAFVRQFVDVSNQLADNYIYTIERNIYYLDNFEKLTPDFIKLMKDYYDEKNQDWLDKYKPLRMESDMDKL